MPQLYSKSSRSYPGRPAWHAALYKGGCVLHGNMRDDQSGVSRSQWCRKFLVAKLETSLAKHAGWCGGWGLKPPATLLELSYQRPALSMSLL